MPVVLNSRLDHAPSGAHVSIGLINNMGDQALKTTERQYLSLLNSVSESMEIHLSLYTLPGIPRNEASSQHIAHTYSDIHDLWEGQLDGLIVTGREPAAQNLTEEPYWESFTRTLAWAQENAHSTVWSCLAAHAAVLHMNGIGRVKRDEKLFGIFACSRTMDHHLTAGIPLDFKLPHSRWNGLHEAQLNVGGYRVLTRTADGEIDTFVLERDKLFVFFQGHPEYDSDTLMREYRRDVARYLRGEITKYPPLPKDYFDRDTVDVLHAQERRARRSRGVDSLPNISALLNKTSVEHSWQSSAKTIYSNWLQYVCAQNGKTIRPKVTQAIDEAQTTSRARAARRDTSYGHMLPAHVPARQDRPILCSENAGLRSTLSGSS